MDLNTICSNILSELEAKNAARDHALHESRAMIRFCANSIRAVHRGEFDEGERLRAEARGCMPRSISISAAFPTSTTPAMCRMHIKELAEANILSALVRGQGRADPRGIWGWPRRLPMGWGGLWASCAASSSTPSGVGTLHAARRCSPAMDDHLLLPDHGGLSPTRSPRPSPDHRLGCAASWEDAGD